MKRLSFLIFYILFVQMIFFPVWSFGAKGPYTTYYMAQAGIGDESGADQDNYMSIAKHNSGTLDSDYFEGDDNIYICGTISTRPKVFSTTSGGTLGHQLVYRGDCPGNPGVIDGAVSVTSWTEGADDVWHATVTASSVNYVTFGGTGGIKKTSSAACTASRNWYWASNVLYVYSAGNPVTVYGAIKAVVFQSAFDVNSKNYITIRNLQIINFDDNGIEASSTTGTQVNYCYIKSGIPHFSTSSQSSGVHFNTATDGSISNSDILQNYIGVQAYNASGCTITNSRVYANMLQGLYTNTGATRLTYSYSHIYANGISSNGRIDLYNDVSDATDGGNNITSTSAPHVRSYSRYPVTLGVIIDDIWDTELAQADTYVTVAQSKDVKIGLAVSPAANVVASPNWDTTALNYLNSWHSSGYVDIIGHNYSSLIISHPTDALDIQYTGNGTACSMDIVRNVLYTYVTGQTDGSTDLTLDLTAAAYDTVNELAAYINGRTGYTASASTGYNTHAIGLADVSSQDIKTSSYTAEMDDTRFVTDELQGAKTFLEANITGFTLKTLIWPGMMNTEADRALALSIGYTGARGGNTANFSDDDTLEAGQNLYNLSSLNLKYLHGKSEGEISNSVRAWAFYSAIWGVPAQGYFHFADDSGNPITPVEIGYVIDAIKEWAIYRSLTDQVTDLRENTIYGDYYVILDPARAINMSPAPSSPTNNAGADLCSTFTAATDLTGKQVCAGGVYVGKGSAPEIGAYEYWPQKNGWSFFNNFEP